MRKGIFRLIYKIIYAIRYAFSKNNKKNFETDKTKIYKFGNEIFCCDKGVFESIVEKYSDKERGFWTSQESYSLADYFPQRYSNQGKMLHDVFMPLFKKKPLLLDIGCASGEWTVEMAPECREIDGFEYSSSLVQTAVGRYSCVENVHFFQGDARTLNFEKQYDGAMLLGMLMYIDNENDFCKILKNIYDHMVYGGYICTKDTLNCEKKNIVFMYNKKNGYNAVYWSQDKYYEMFEKSGFKLKEEILLDEVKTRRMHFIARGAIWQKV